MSSSIARRSFGRITGIMSAAWAPFVRRAFFSDIVRKTNNFGSITWLGNPVWQNVFDLWTIQETISLIRPELLIETGTNRGGSSLFYAHLFDLMAHGRVLTVDVEKLHDLSHPRVGYIIGSSTASETIAKIEDAVAQSVGPVMVILDSDHSTEHVRRELELYSRFVTSGSYLLVQDGAMDTLPALRASFTGPLPAIEGFLRTHEEFEIDQVRCDRFLITHHPKGWLRRR